MKIRHLEEFLYCWLLVHKNSNTSHFHWFLDLWSRVISINFLFSQLPIGLKSFAIIIRRAAEYKDEESWEQRKGGDSIVGIEGIGIEGVCREV